MLVSVLSFQYVQNHTVEISDLFTLHADQMVVILTFVPFVVRLALMKIDLSNDPELVKGD